MKGHDWDVVVIGGGPAGVNAALAAATAGLRVALFDDNASAGGQVYRAPVFRPAPATEPGDDERAGDALRARLAHGDVALYFDHQVWAVTGEYRIDAIGPDGPLHVTTAALIVAAGTTERVVPFDGWTTPGVIGLATATILLKSQGILPGRTTLVAGCGPLLAAVAAKTIEGGGHVAALADIAGRRDWARTLPALLSRPDLLRQGWAWGRTIRRAGTPVLSRHAIERVEAHGDLLRATLAPCDAAGRPVAGTRRTVTADCVAVGHGLTPASDITRALRAEHVYSRAAGGWIARADAHGRTSRKGLYVAGDGAGIAGAQAAGLHGTLAGRACANDLGAWPLRRPAPEIRAREPHGAPAVRPVPAAPDTTLRAYRRAARVGHAMAGLMALRAGHVDSVAPDTVVCRCEDVTRAEIDAACDAGARDVNQLKAWTRCGMGPCQGRTCGDVAAELLARRIARGRGVLLPAHAIAPAVDRSAHGTLHVRRHSHTPGGAAMTPKQSGIAAAASARRTAADADADADFDVAVVGGGVMGCTTALFLARAGMRVAVIEREALCRGASGVNAGTLTLHMTRAALVPYAIKAWDMWMHTDRWLSHGVLATQAPGLSLAFTENERLLLRERAAARRAYGARIDLLDRDAALAVEPGLNHAMREAAFCTTDGYASAYLTGRAFHAALAEAGATVFEHAPATRIDRVAGRYEVHVHGEAPGERTPRTPRVPAGRTPGSAKPPAHRIRATRLVMAGGVWLEPLLAMLDVHIPVKTLVNQLIVTERLPPVMRSVLSIANGLLSMKQFANGTVLIGGGWQGVGDRERGGVETLPQNLIGNLQLARHVLPALRHARVARIWLGLESETADAMPMIGGLPGLPNAYVIGCAHSGYTSGPYMGKLLSQAILGDPPEMPLFDPARLLTDAPRASSPATAVGIPFAEETP